MSPVHCSFVLVVLKDAALWEIETDAKQPQQLNEPDKLSLFILRQKWGKRGRQKLSAFFFLSYGLAWTDDSRENSPHVCIDRWLLEPTEDALFLLFLLESIEW